MTTSMARPRTGSAKWGRPRSSSQARAVPQQSLDLDLTITGTPTPGLNPDSSRILHWPLAHLQKPDKGKQTVPKSTAWRTDDELVEQVKDKLTTGLEGVRQLFKTRDPYGDSIVTREGLFLIIKTLVGHVTRDQFDSFLKTINLHWRSCISFDEFIVRFQDNPVVAMHQVAELARRQQKQHNLEENLKNQDLFEWYPFTTAPHAFVIFRKRLQKSEVNVGDILPESCFLNDGRVIMPQLREALAVVGLRLTDQEFQHIWNKFDPDNNGSVPIKKFYKTLNLSQNGFPLSDPRAIKSAGSPRRSDKGKESTQRRGKTQLQMSTTNRQNASVSVSKVDTVVINGSRAEILGGGNENKCGKTSNNQKLTTEVTTTTEETETTTTKRTTRTTTEKREEQLIDDAKLSSHVRSLIQAKKSPPQFHDVIDHLHFKASDASQIQFEETFRNLHSAFRLFDFMNDGYIARIDFRRVLKEFGFEIAAIDLDAFLARAGISVVQGLINYKQFLNKFQSRGDSSILTKVMLRDGESLHKSFRRFETEEILRAEEMEKDVSNYFHADYLKLLGLLKQKDKNNTGVVNAQELRSAVNSVLKTKMSDLQFDELIQRLSEKSSNGSPQINYSTFLDIFNSEPGHWNRNKDGHFITQKYQLGDITPATPVLRLQEKAKTWMAPSAEKSLASNSRVTEIKKELTKLFTNRFHVFDKNFQDMDRKRCGYMSKWQFGALIKLCGITLSVSDLDYLWATLETAADNTLNYATLVKTFTSGHQKQETAEKQCPSRLSQKATVGTSDRQKTVPTITTVPQPQVVTGSAKERRLTELIKKVKEDVMARWDVLYSIFLSLDRDGYSSIAVDDMKDVAYKMKFSLTSSERDELCNYFDIYGNGWFHYLSFLHAVKKLSQSPEVSPCVFNIHTKRLHQKAGPTSMALTVHDFLCELKGLLLKKFKTLRGSFKFFDHNHNGFIEETELRKSLTMLGYALSHQDFLDILQIFDRSQGQRLSFEDFKTTLLTI